MRYGIPGKDANTTLTVNGKANSNPLGLKNFITAGDGDLGRRAGRPPGRPWIFSKGTNTIKISCEQGDKCDVLLDWLQVGPPK